MIMNNDIIISLCIPTYNRAKYLKKSIESVIKQKAFKNGKIEIIISDNASNDNTENMCLNFVNKYKNIHYYRNDVNRVDENFQ